MHGGSIPRMGTHGANGISRYIGVSVALAAVIIAVAVTVALFFAAKHGVPQAGGMIWVRN